MEMIHGWILALCSLALLYTVLEGFLPEKEPFPVIKLTCILYILITLLTPAKQTVFKMAFPQIPDPETVCASGEAFYQDSVLNQTSLLLEKKLTQDLLQKKIAVEEVSVRLKREENGDIGVPEVKVILAAYREGVSQAVCEQLGCEAVVTVEEV